MNKSSVFIVIYLMSTPVISAVNDRVTASWNMQGSSNTGENKWQQNVRSIMNSHQNIEVLALQESGEPPSSAMLLPARDAVPIENYDGVVEPVSQYTWEIGTSTRRKTLYIFHLRVGNRVNLSIVTTERPDEIILLSNTRPRDIIARPTMGVRFNRDIYYTLHSLARASNEAPETIAYIYGCYEGMQNGNQYQWMVMGDFNRSPESLMNDLTSTLPSGVTIVSQNSPTQISGGNLDYAIIGQVGSTYSFAATAWIFIASLLGQHASDHTPILFKRSQ